MNVQSRFRDLEPSAVTPRAKTKKAPRARMLWIAVLAAMILLAGGYYFVFARASNSTGQPIIATASRGDVEDVVTAVGNLQPLTSVDVGAQVSGQLTKISVLIGDDVKKGQLL